MSRSMRALWRSVFNNVYTSMFNCKSCAELESTTSFAAHSAIKGIPNRASKSLLRMSPYSTCFYGKIEFSLFL